MYNCTRCSKVHYFPVLLDCNHTMCAICFYELKQRYPYKMAIYNCEVCNKPCLLNDFKEIIIDDERHLLESEKIPEDEEEIK